MKKAIKRLMMKEIEQGRSPNRLYYSATNTYRAVISGSLDTVYTATIIDVDTDLPVTATNVTSRKNAAKALIGQLSALQVAFAVKPKEMALGPAYALVDDLDFSGTDPMEPETTATFDVDPTFEGGNADISTAPDFYVSIVNLTPELVKITSPTLIKKSELVSGNCEIEVESLALEGTARIEVNYGGLIKVLEIEIAAA